MSVADIPGSNSGSGGARVRDLLRRCGLTHDRAERAALFARVAYELDQAADEIAAQDQAHEVSTRELVAALHGQASMARFMADLERRDHAHHVAHSRAAYR